MQDVALEVESNILATNKLRGKSDRDRRKQKAEASSSDASIINPQVDELNKFVKSLSAEMERLKLEGRQTNRNPQDFRNINNFRRPNNTPQIMQRDHRNRKDQKVQTPLQNNLVDDEEGNNEEADQEIHCLGDATASPNLTQTTYE
jgi:hypothetical protein